MEVIEEATVSLAPVKVEMTRCIRQIKSLNEDVFADVVKIYNYRKSHRAQVVDGLRLLYLEREDHLQVFLVFGDRLLAEYPEVTNFEKFQKWIRKEMCNMIGKGLTKMLIKGKKFIQPEFI